MRLISLAGIALLIVSIIAPSRAADLVVLSAAAMRSSMEDVPARFEKASGHHVRFVFGTAGAIRDKIAAGETVDLVILPPAPLDALVKAGLVVEGSRTDLVRVELGAAVKAGTRPPAIGSEAEFKQALLDAPALGIADPASGATSGIFLAKLLDRLGIADAVRPKLKLYPDGSNAMEAVARGEIAFAAGQISEIKPVPGIAYIGKLPEALQLQTIYAAGLAARSQAIDAARALEEFLASPQMAPIYEAKGFERM